MTERTTEQIVEALASGRARLGLVRAESLDAARTRVLREPGVAAQGRPMSLHPGAEIPRGGGAVTQHPWPDDCAVQGGTSSLVIVRKGENYTTAFFEAFPRSPQTFLRGEGPSVEEAEDAAWAKWQRIVACPSGGAHEYEARGYRNGCGFCKHCGLFTSGVFDLAEIGSVCVVCGIGTYWTTDEQGNLLCEEHAPREKCYHGCGQMLSRAERMLHVCGDDEPLIEQEFADGLREVLTSLTEPPTEQEGR